MMEVPLPKDHEGREIPLDTEVLYDAKGGEMHVSSYRYQRDVLGLSTGWNVISEDAVGQIWQHPADGLYLNRPDSWKKQDEGRALMSRDFIELYDDDGYRYIVNMDKISFVNVAGRKVWAGEAATLAICDESMERLLSRLRGEGDAD